MSLLGLVPDYGSDSSSSSDSDEKLSEPKKLNPGSDDKKHTGTPQYENKTPLPLPQLELDGPSTSKPKTEPNSRALQTTSVFFNPFLAEEKKKLSVLERHVQLSESKPEESNDRKKTCFKFQKGKCRLGDKCKFSHGVALEKPSVESSQRHTVAVPSLFPTFYNQERRYEPDEEEESWELSKRKKRKCGVTDSLVPPKRAIIAYEKQQATDRPWSRS